MEASTVKSIFSRGPAPPGDRPPNTDLFTRLETHLVEMSHRVKVITARIDLLRDSYRLEPDTAMRRTIKEHVIKALKDQILVRQLMAKYSLKLKALQEAEISKVVRHLQGIDKIYEAKIKELALIKGMMKQQTDPAKVRSHQRGINALIKWQKNTRMQRERWRMRLIHMEAAKVKELKPPTSSKQVNASEKISTPQPTETKSNNDVVMADIGKNVSTPKPKTENTNQEYNKNVEISTSKSNTDTESHPNKVALKSKEGIDIRNEKMGCKRCAYLQRANKSLKHLPKVCKVCLKWAHKVLQNGVEMAPNKSKQKNNTTINSTTVSKSVMSSTLEPAVDADSMSMIKPVTEMQESLTQMDPPKPLSYVEIEVLDASSNDEIMKSMDDEIVSDVITEEKTENLAKTEVVDFEEVISIQDGLKAIEDKNTALAHVRILQEYAMLHDNFRAIGLLSEVEAALISPPKIEDFEY